MYKAYILTVNSLLKYLLGSSSAKVTKTNDIHIISSYKLVLYNISITHIAQFCPNMYVIQSIVFSLLIYAIINCQWENITTCLQRKTFV